MKKVMSCICALCFICVPLNVRAMEEIPISSFNGFDWAEYYFDEDEVECNLPLSAGKYSACDENDNCVEFRLIEPREMVEVRVKNPECYYEDEGYVPVLDVIDTYPELKVMLNSDGKFELMGTSNYSNVDFILKTEGVTYKKRVVDLYKPNVTCVYSSNGITLEGVTYREVGEYEIKVPHDYNLDHYEVINDTYTLTIIEDKKDTNKNVVISSKETKAVEVPKKEGEVPKKEVSGIHTGVRSSAGLFGLVGAFSLVGIVVLKRLD